MRYSYPQIRLFDQGIPNKVYEQNTFTVNLIDQNMSPKLPGASVVSPAHCVGPNYRPDEQKPTATVSTEVSYETVHILPQTPQLIALLTYAAFAL